MIFQTFPTKHQLRDCSNKKYFDKDVLCFRDDFNEYIVYSRTVVDIHHGLITLLWANMEGGREIRHAKLL